MTRAEDRPKFVHTPVSPERRAQLLREMEEIREQAIRDGLELWTADRIRDEIEERRRG